MLAVSEQISIRVIVIPPVRWFPFHFFLSGVTSARTRRRCTGSIPLRCGRFREPDCVKGDSETSRGSNEADRMWWRPLSAVTGWFDRFTSRDAVLESRSSLLWKPCCGAPFAAARRIRKTPRQGHCRELANFASNDALVSPSETYRSYPASWFPFIVTREHSNPCADRRFHATHGVPSFCQSEFPVHNRRVVPRWTRERLSRYKEDKQLLHRYF